MICVEWPCDVRINSWKEMNKHYRKEHPYVKRPDKYYTKKAREANP